MAVISCYPSIQLPPIGYHLLSQSEKQKPTFTKSVSLFAGCSLSARL